MGKTLIARKETHEVLILSRRRINEKRFCAACQTQVPWLVPEEAMLLKKTSLREIFRRVETNEIHFAENARGFLLVCAKSLLNCQAAARAAIHFLLTPSSPMQVLELTLTLMA